MTTAVEDRPVRRASAVKDRGADGGTPGRRAVMRWAWRMFRREGRRQVLIVVLLSVAVAATIIGLGLISNVVGLGPNPTFGTASTILTLQGGDANLSADIAAIEHRFGPADVVAHQSTPIPGSVSALDLRAENPSGPFVAKTIRLDSGHYPNGAGQVALTSDAMTTFGLHLGDAWQAAGTSWRVVGTVENPLDLLDNFALVAPGQLTSPDHVAVLVDASRQSLRSFHLPGIGLQIDQRGTASKAAAEAIVLVLATIGLLFVGLLAVAGFAVMAQRRIRALGMLSALGATERQVRLVMVANGAAVGATSAVAGAAVGLGSWIAFAPRMQSIVEHRIDRFSLPWWAIGAALVLAFVTAVIAAWWPARAITRVPIMAALSGRPPRPQPARRFAAVGFVLLAAGIGLLLFAYEHHAPVIISGTVATVVGMLFMAPLAIQATATLAGRAPVAVRLALHDLARYRARSGAALGAATLAVAIAATIAVASAASAGPDPVPNLAPNQMVLYIGGAGGGPGNPIPVLTADQQQAAQSQVDQLAHAIGATTVLPLAAAVNPDAPLLAPPPGAGPGLSPGQIPAALARVLTSARGEEIINVVPLYVATPEVLARFGINPDRINPSTDIISSRRDLGGLQIFLPILAGDGPAAAKPVTRPSEPPEATKPTIQVVNQLPIDRSDPGILITPHALQILGLQSIPAGWFLQTTHPLTAAQISTARRVAATTGLQAETTFTNSSQAQLRNWSTAVGILLALGVLAATVGLIRSETAGDLRTLAATGASSSTRKAITAATAGALALLGAVVGTAGAYGALLAWYRNNLHPLTNIPLRNLVVLVLALPVLATVGGWLLAGQEPPTIARPPLE